MSSRNHDVIKSVFMDNELRSCRDEVKYRSEKEAKTEQNNVSPVKVLRFPYYSTLVFNNLISVPPFNIILLLLNSATFALFTNLISTSFDIIVIKILRFKVKVFFLYSQLVKYSKLNNYISIFCLFNCTNNFLFNISS